MAEWKIDEGVDEEGLVEDPYQGVETYYCPLEAAFVTEHYLRLVGDNGGTNVEIRLSIEALKMDGWMPPEDLVSRLDPGREGRVTSVAAQDRTERGAEDQSR